MRTRLTLAPVLLWAALACTSTVVEKSAQPLDPDQAWEEQMARAARFQRRGIYPSAERFYTQAFEISQSFRPGDPRVIDTLSQRAEVRLARGQYAEAERDFRAIIERERSTRGRGAELANALNNLAVFYVDLDRIPEAEALLTEALEIRIAIYGGRHPFVAVLLQNLADAERRVENYENAEQLFVRALSIYALSGEKFYREASIAQNNLARVYGATQREEESERHHLDAIRLSIKARGERNSDVGVFTRNLAMLYTRQRRYDEAEGLYQGSISILRETLGNANYQLSKTYRAYSQMLLAAGRVSEAREYERRADATGY